MKILVVAFLFTLVALPHAHASRPACEKAINTYAFYYGDLRDEISKAKQQAYFDAKANKKLGVEYVQNPAKIEQLYIDQLDPLFKQVQSLRERAFKKCN